MRSVIPFSSRPSFSGAGKVGPGLHFTVLSGRGTTYVSFRSEEKMTNRLQCLINC